MLVPSFALNYVVAYGVLINFELSENLLIVVSHRFGRRVNVRRANVMFLRRLSTLQPLK